MSRLWVKKTVPQNTVSPKTSVDTATGDVAITLHQVSKSFKQYANPIQRLRGALLGNKDLGKDFWALQDISLEVRRGETLGIIGRNGAGKSTLLQIICGTLRPSSGQVQVQGRVAALLELGAGFNPEFSGRENVFMNAAILGLSRPEIQDRLDVIETFADIGEFIHQPVKTYSSGMFMRLAFAVAIHVDPDILIVDEALSVGDIFFQQKCFQRLNELKASGTSIIFVSHSTQAVVNLCDRAILLQQGQLTQAGPPAEIAAKYIETYYEQTAEGQDGLPTSTSAAALAEAEVAVADPVPVAIDPDRFITDFSQCKRYGKAVGLVRGMAITDSQGQSKTVFEMGEELVFSIWLGEHSDSLCPLNVGFQLRNNLGQVFIGTNTCLLKQPIQPELFGQAYICQFRFPLAVTAAQYTLTLAVAEFDPDAKVVYDWIESAAALDVIVHGWPTQVGFCTPEIGVFQGPPAFS